MGNNWFKKAGNLNNNEMSYFQRGGSLEEPKKVSGTFFKPAGSLEEPAKTNTVFRTPGDLDTPTQSNSFEYKESKEVKTPEEIRAWLKTIVSGEKKANYAFGEGLQITGAGQKFVSIEELEAMVQNGDNIIKAEYFANMNMVMIEFERFGIHSKSR